MFSIDAFKENLSQIALDVHDAADGLELSRSSVGEPASVSGRRTSYQFDQSKSPLRSSSKNGIDAGIKAEFEQYKAEIKRLQVSEAEIKALSINYAAILKEKEEQFFRLREENGSLRKRLEADGQRYAPRNDSLKTLTSSSSALKGDGNQSNSRQHRHTSERNTHFTGNHVHGGNGPKHDVSSNGTDEASQSLLGREKDPIDLFKENQSSVAVQAAYQSEIKQLREQLEKAQADLANTKVQLEGEHISRESSQKEINILKMDNDRALMEVKELRNDLDKKTLEIRRLQSELNRRDMEEPVVSAESMKSVLTALEKENANLKSEKDELISALKLHRQHTPDVNNAVDSKASSKHFSNVNEVQSSEKLLGQEDTALSQMWEQKLKDASRERDKALQELARLKQHLLEKSN